MQYAAAGLAVIAAILGGLGVIFWIAANWETVTRAGRFAVLEGFLGVMFLGAVMRPAARIPLSLVGFLATGGLLALFGQTYQTGADPWQMFAWWSGLMLPLCFGAKHDALWTAWSLVAMTALRLWSRAEGGHAWASAPPLPIHQLLYWFGALLPAIALSPKFTKYTDAGVWSLRLGVLLATSAISADALKFLFDSQAPGWYFLGLALLAVMFVGFCKPVLFDIFALCVLALGLNVLIDSGMTRALTSGQSNGSMVLLIIGVISAALLGATVKIILAISRTSGMKWSFQ